MVHGKNRIPYWIDRRLTGLAGPDYDATISFGLPFESEDSQYGKYRLNELETNDRQVRVALMGHSAHSHPCLTCRCDHCGINKGSDIT